jgi:hypothetical protein
MEDAKIIRVLEERLKANDKIIAGLTRENRILKYAYDRRDYTRFSTVKK